MEKNIEEERAGVEFNNVNIWIKGKDYLKALCEVLEADVPEKARIFVATKILANSNPGYFSLTLSADGKELRGWREPPEFSEEGFTERDQDIAYWSGIRIFKVYGDPKIVEKYLHAFQKMSFGPRSEHCLKDGSKFYPQGWI